MKKIEINKNDLLVEGGSRMLPSFNCFSKCRKVILYG